MECYANAIKELWNQKFGECPLRVTFYREAKGFEKTLTNAFQVMVGSRPADAWGRDWDKKYSGHFGTESELQSRLEFLVQSAYDAGCRV